MAKTNYAVCEKRVIDSEGSKYTDGKNPYDPGGPTRWGITLADAKLHWKPGATAEDVRLMPITVALQIYKSKYWDAVSADQLPSGVDYTVFDYGVNSGIGRSGKVLRRLVGLPDNTSKITVEVLAAVNKRDPLALIHAMNKERLTFLQTLKIWPTYKNGWTTRVHGVDSFSTQLANAPAATVAAAPVLTPANNDNVPNAGIAPKEIIEGTAKGQVPPPTAAKAAIHTTTATTTASGGYVWWDWIVAHPGATAIIAACVVTLVVVAIKALNDAHREAQEAPTANWEVVPEIKAA